MTDTAAVRAFIEKWERNTQKESSAAKEHFADLCRLLGVPTPNDPGSGPDAYCFEKSLTKSGGTEPQGDPRVEAIAEAARELVRLRDEWLAGGEPALTPNPSPIAMGEGSSDGGELSRTPAGTSATPAGSDAMTAGTSATPAQTSVTPRESNAMPGVQDSSLKDRTLTNLYNKRPDWLDHAHRRLDAAVIEAYGWPHDPSTGSGQALSDDEILARLLALNLERAAGQGAVAAQVDGEENNAHEE